MNSIDHPPEPKLAPIDAQSVDVVHELNNLLTIVLGSLDQLHRQSLNPRGKAQLERAQWGVEQAGKLMHQVIGSGS